MKKTAKILPMLLIASILGTVITACSGAPAETTNQSLATTAPVTTTFPSTNPPATVDQKALSPSQLFEKIAKSKDNFSMSVQLCAEGISESQRISLDGTITRLVVVMSIGGEDITSDSYFQKNQGEKSRYYFQQEDESWSYVCLPETDLTDEIASEFDPEAESLNAFLDDSLYGEPDAKGCRSSDKLSFPGMDTVFSGSYQPDANGCTVTLTPIGDGGSGEITIIIDSIGEVKLTLPEATEISFDEFIGEQSEEEMAMEELNLALAEFRSADRVAYTAELMDGKDDHRLIFVEQEGDRYHFIYQTADQREIEHYVEIDGSGELYLYTADKNENWSREVATPAEIRELLPYPVDFIRRMESEWFTPVIGEEGLEGFVGSSTIIGAESEYGTIEHIELRLDGEGTISIDLGVIIDDVYYDVEYSADCSEDTTVRLPQLALG